MYSSEYDIIIMDEVGVAIHFELLKTEDVVYLLREKPDSVEIILTDRYCPPVFIAMADLVTEMLEIKQDLPERGERAKRPSGIIISQ
jgi:cob(I)alamin adenosyltransferase